VQLNVIQIYFSC